MPAHSKRTTTSQPASIAPAISVDSASARTSAPASARRNTTSTPKRISRRTAFPYPRLPPTWALVAASLGPSAPPPPRAILPPRSAGLVGDDRDPELVELGLLDRRRRPRHRVEPGLVLRERDRVAEVRLAREHHQHPVDPE